MIDRILFLMEKYCDADPKHGQTNSESQLVGAIESTGLVKEIKHFYFDVFCQQFGKNRMGELLLEDCQVFQPDLVIYTPIGGMLGFQFNPPDWTLKRIREMGKTLLTCLWDTTGIEEEIKQRWILHSDYTCAIDSIATLERFSSDPRVIPAYPAVESRVFYDKKLVRNIDVCFVGDINSARTPHRLPQINFLKSNGINIIIAGGQRDSRLSWQEYANYLNRSKISLNWSRHPNTTTAKLKARVFETMSCGAMLMEDNGSETKKLFELGKDFIIFENPDDLLRKVRYYLKYKEEREAIALSGYRKATTIYNARNMWAYIFERIGFELPESLRNDRNFQIHKKKIWSKDSSS